MGSRSRFPAHQIRCPQMWSGRSSRGDDFGCHWVPAASAAGCGEAVQSQRMGRRGLRTRTGGMELVEGQRHHHAGKAECCLESDAFDSRFVRPPFLQDSGGSSCWHESCRVADATFMDRYNRCDICYETGTTRWATFGQEGGPPEFCKVPLPLPPWR